MEMRSLKTVVLVVMFVGLVLQTEKASASFKDCYTRCFLTCMIDPAQNLCNCTTHCLKDCIFSDILPSEVEADPTPASDNLGFCKLGCAFSTCMTFSTKNKPNGDKMDNCVGSCSNKCTESYSALP